MDSSRLILLMVALLAGLGCVALLFQAVREQRNTVSPPPPAGLVALENPLDLVMCRRICLTVASN